MNLTVENVSARYDGAEILRSISFSVEKEQFVSIVGPSGCGKSTLLNLIAGILPLADGQLHLDEKPVQGISPHVALMPQDDLLLPWMTVLDNVCLYGKIHGSKPQLREKALENLEQFGLRGYESAYPHQLSGGMRQRAAFLRTALCPAKLLLLDEPFAALDVITRQEMQDWLRQKRQNLQSTVLLVTHDIDEALYLSDRILVLGGRPAQIVKEFEITEPNRDRRWLFHQGAQKSEIHQWLKGEG